MAVAVSFESNVKLSIDLGLSISGCIRTSMPRLQMCPITHLVCPHPGLNLNGESVNIAYATYLRIFTDRALTKGPRNSYGARKAPLLVEGSMSRISYHFGFHSDFRPRTDRGVLGEDSDCVHL